MINKLLPLNIFQKEECNNIILYDNLDTFDTFIFNEIVPDPITLDTGGLIGPHVKIAIDFKGTKCGDIFNGVATR